MTGGTVASTFADYVEEFPLERLLDEFAIHHAQALLLVGSRLTGTSHPSSDIDFLAIFEDAGDVPTDVPLPGVVSMPHSLGENWIGDIDGHETNVEAVTADTIRRIVALLGRRLDERAAPLVQPLELRLLDRLRRNLPVRGGDYVSTLCDQRLLDRLPMVGVVIRYCGVRSNLPALRHCLDNGDHAGFALLRSVLAGAIGLATMSLHGHVDTAWRKVTPVLLRLEAEGHDLPVSAADIESMLAVPNDRTAYEQVYEATERVRAAVAALAGGDHRWAEALRGLDAQP